MEAQIFGLVLVMVYACAAFAHPANSRREDFKHLVSLLGKLKDIDGGHLSRQDTLEAKAGAGLEEDALSRNLLDRAGGMLVKRQGEWSYDYGLGGGRFGKRNYGDYGIGGGRFGRDVDHVDLADANDPDLLS